MEGERGGEGEGGGRGKGGGGAISSNHCLSTNIASRGRGGGEEDDEQGTLHTGDGPALEGCEKGRIH